MSVLLALALLAGSGVNAGAAATAVRALPATVAGLERHWDHRTREDSPLVAFHGPAATDPLVVVAIRPIDTLGDVSSARAIAKAQPLLASIRQTMFEGRFAVPSRPGANTVLGEYLTDHGLMQVWLVEHGGVRTLVSVTILRMEDRLRMFDAIRTELLGGATMIKEPPAAAENRKTYR